MTTKMVQATMPMNDSDLIPLDPNEGPTIWLRLGGGNHHTHSLIVGTDPDNPLRSVQVSSSEIKRAYHTIQNYDNR